MIATNLTSLRAARRLTLGALAAAANLQPPYLAALEAATAPVLPTAILERLAAALGVSAAQLTGAVPLPADLATPRPDPGPDPAAWARRLAALPPADQALVATLVARLERAARPAAPPAPSPRPTPSRRPPARRRW